VRIWTLEEIFQRWPSLKFRIAFESALPTLAAFIWGAKALATTGKAFDALTAALIAFPLVLYVQGQILRMAKNVRDEKDAEEFRTSFASIQQAIDELRSQGAPQPLPQPEQPVPQPPEGLNFMAQAQQLLTAGQYFPAVLVAAVGFETTARVIAREMRWDAERVPLGRIIRELAIALPSKQDAERLETLNRLRNSVVHAEGEVPWVQQEEAEEMVQAFSQGATTLSRAAIDYDFDHKGRGRQFRFIRRDANTGRFR
jgi:hypothetical protein